MPFVVGELCHGIVWGNSNVHEINCVFLFTFACDSIVPGPELFPVYSVFQNN